jgi:N-alpha-acetyl-L-2,4-diaminobutyrate deacetylase
MQSPVEQVPVSEFRLNSVPDGTKRRIHLVIDNAHAFQTHVVGQADLFLDIHSAGNMHAIKELAGYQVRPGELGRMQKEAAIAFGLDLVWGTGPLPGRSLSAAGDRRVPAIYVEMRGEGRCRPDQVEKATDGVRNILAFLKIIDQPFPTVPPRYCFETTGEEAGHLQIDHPSPTSGIFVSAVGLWDRVEKGTPLGWVRHPDGRVLAEVSSARLGRVLFLRTLPRVFSGDSLAYVLALPEGVE